MTSNKPPLRLTIAIAIAFTLPIVAGVAAAARRAWLCDDIFITFRYVEHLAQGAGLVYNAGEHVMGYTHFLWAILLAAARGLGIDLLVAGRVLPFVAWCALLAVLALRSLGFGFAPGAPRPRLAWVARDRSAWLALPVAAWGAALHHDLQSYATGGLETSAFAVFLLAGLLFVTARRRVVELGAAAYAIATLLRPEGAAYAALAALFLAWRFRSRRELVRFVALYAALVLPFVIWEWTYYGTLVPNAFYSKSAALSYWSQGWIYTRLYFGIYWILAACFGVALALGILAAVRARHAQRAVARTPEPFDTSLGLVALALAQVAFTVLYVTRVGGDFMFARFYLPATPLLYLVAEEIVRRTGRRAAMALLAIAVIAGTLAARIPHRATFHGCEKVAGIADEPQCYGDTYMTALREQGEALQRLFAGTEARVIVTGGQAMLAYWGKLPYAIEGTGLTNVRVARQPLVERGRPGHEKGVPDDYLRRERIHFRVLYGAHRATGLREHEKLIYGRMILRTIVYDPDLMRVLATRPGVQFIDFQEYLDAFAAADLRRHTPAALLEEFRHHCEFYFRPYPDAERLQRVRRALEAAGVAPADLDSVLRD